ncbi:hypothetical protein Taro_006019 [Colocasia esculenta]|uniref:Uncharacterized protein n=1 Tax=Colocasia esculenta TaxID=4460 RepID=A0A843TRE8_COLES|nr:hypothetical protein [Colocasia esculenta]
MVAFGDFRSGTQIPLQERGHKTSFRGRKTFVSHSKIEILADELPYSKYRLPRLRESLAEPTRGAAQSQRSEVVFNST